MVVNARQLLIESIGAFFVTFATIGFANNPLGLGLIFMAMVYIAGWKTGYFNPAITLALSLGRVLEWRACWEYLAAQLLGAFVASLGLIFVFGEPFCPSISPEIFPVAAAGIEVLLSFVLCAVALAVVVRQNRDFGWLIIGLTLVAVSSFGGVFNPAIALSSLVTGIFYGGGICQVKDLVVFLLAPFLGSVAAVLLHQLRAE